MIWIRLHKTPQRPGWSGKETWLKVDDIWGIEEAPEGSVVKTLHEVITVSEKPMDIIKMIVGVKQEVCKEQLRKSVK